eukprot:TRINITY_DN1128_c0_g2_i1.p1 TRINITY_DN1128_c0_g2~~TRINITY_DN1128_c0_g2_i1.p1  ORF type:complete len:511 (-),score=137.29 TRINITY_DN1128_c0_g2_i1:255-1745(-)
MDMEASFKAFCAGHNDMDGKSFAKLCKDCHLLDKKFTTTDVDLIFSKSVKKGQRRIDFSQFSAALEMVAERKGVALEDVHSNIGGSAGPVHAGTRADEVRFHDDKDTYTGSHAEKHVGPRPSQLQAPQGAAPAADAEKPSPRPSQVQAAPVAAPAAGGAADNKDLEASFKAFCASGHDGMDGKSFAKLCKDCHLLDKKFTATDVDIIFSKAVSKGQRRLDFSQFSAVLEMIAEKKGVNVEVVRANVGSSGGPVHAGTRAEAVRFHDDKDSYTGSHSDKPAAPRLSQLQAAQEAPAAPVDQDVQASFKDFCNGQKDMDGKGFAKLCKDCHILSKKFSATDADIIFSKVVKKGQRRIDVSQFARALELIAEKKGVDLEDVHANVGCSAGPVHAGTRADAVRFHDDTSTYTGAHAEKHAAPEKLKQRFRELDANHDGVLNFEEMKQILRKGNPNLTDAQLRLVFNGADANGNGSLDFDEFVNFLFKPPKAAGARRSVAK